jgi:hypothetical protein
MNDDEIELICECCGEPFRLVRVQLPGIGWSAWVAAEPVAQSTANS